jgi:integrase
MSRELRADYTTQFLFPPARVTRQRMLRYDLEDKKRTFFNFRHTGASHITQRGKTPAHLLAVVQMMGDTSVATVNRHYFKDGAGVDAGTRTPM